MEWVIGIALIVLGVGLSSNALNMVHRAARLWPRPYAQGDGGRFATTSFLIRFVGLLLAAAGIAVVWMAAI